MADPIEVVELTAQHVDDYLRLFDSAFRDNAEWAGCYCAFHDDTSGRPFLPESDGAEHRAARAIRVRSGAARGLLAYADGVPVGWCNVGPRSEVPNLRAFGEAVENAVDDPAVIMCFVIDPDWRGRGVASALVRGAVAASRRWGVPWLEAYPADPNHDTEGQAWSAAFYTGPLGMYEAAGFRVVGERRFGFVVRHELAT